MVDDRAPLGLLIAALGAAVLAVSVFLPWYGVSITASGAASAQQELSTVAQQYGNASFQTGASQFGAEFSSLAGRQLATVSAQGVPSARVVLLKGIERGAFVFYTNYFSRKGRELETRPQACAVFLWSDLERQVRIEGSVEKVTPQESDAYYGTRPLGARTALGGPVTGAGLQLNEHGAGGRIGTASDRARQDEEGGKLGQELASGGGHVSEHLLARKLRHPLVDHEQTDGAAAHRKLADRLERLDSGCGGHDAVLLAVART